MPNYTAESREAGRAPLPMGERRDSWWYAPLYTAVVLTAFGIYSTVRAFQHRFFCWPWDTAAATDVRAAYHAIEQATYQSPFYSPYIPISIDVGVMVSPAFYILVFPLAFRMTCYYYRKAYYRAYFLDPAGCAVPEPLAEARMRYTGERGFPFVLQNLHRFAFYIAALFILILAYDAYKAFWFTGADGVRHFHIGLGTLIMWVNVAALAAYTFGCHSCRHLVGGKDNCYSCSNMARTKHGLWRQVSFLNSKHALYAWVSLYTVALTDLYIYLVSAGVFRDPHILF